MDHTSTAGNFLFCLQSHPSFQPEGGKILIGYSENYKTFSHDLKNSINAQYPLIEVSLFDFHQCDAEELKKGIEWCTNYVLFYDSDYSAPQLKPPYILAIEPYLKQTALKSCLIKNYKMHIDEAFGTHPLKIKSINDRLMQRASTAKKMTYKNSLGSHLDIEIENANWTSLDGCGNMDLTPGEIATIGKLNGKAFFTGTFLSTLPFAYNYGIITDKPLYLEFKDNEITHFSGISKDFEEQFGYYLSFRKSNRTVEEVGIGTSPLVKLHGVNAGFEERHVGLHLGLGGAEAGSNHMDLIFQDGEILFDDTIIVQNEKLKI